MKQTEKNYVKHIKKGDQVKVITGEQKGFLGIISEVITKKSSVILEGIAPRIKYVKNSTPNQESQKIEVPILIHVSNVMLWDKEKNIASRIGYKLDPENKNEKRRYFKESGNFLPIK
jgi:large subunit ribosomal protein L24